MYISGGRDPSKLFGDLWEYNLFKHKWKQISKSTPACRYFCLHNVIPFNNRLWFIGGLHSENIYMYSLEKQIWWRVTERGKHIPHKSLCKACMHEGRVYLIDKHSSIYTAKLPSKKIPVLNVWRVLQRSSFHDTVITCVL